MRIVDRMSPALRWAVLALAALVILTTIGVVVISRSPRGADAHPDALAGPSGTASSAGPSGTAPSTGAQQSATSDPGPSPTPSAGGRPSPSLSAAPARSTAPAQLGGRGGWPNADNTGVPTGHRLTSSGAIRVTKPGTVIDGLDLHGDISVEADNVTIRNCRIVTAGTWGIIQRQNAAGLIVRDSDIRGNGKDQLQHAIFNLGGMITIEGNDMSVLSDPISTSVGLIVDNYLHDPKYFPGDHTDMIQSNSGPASGQRLIIRHNTIINTLDQTAAVALFQDFGVQHDALIEDNLLAGGGYAIYAGAGNKGRSSNIQVINNVFSRQVFQNGGYFGPVAYWDADSPGNVWQSNVWADTGAVVEP